MCSIISLKFVFVSVHDQMWSKSSISLLCSVTIVSVSERKSTKGWEGFVEYLESEFVFLGVGCIKVIHFWDKFDVSA